MTVILDLRFPPVPAGKMVGGEATGLESMALVVFRTSRRDLPPR